MYKKKKNISHVSCRTSFKKGFSIIELLIVIVIMTIMTSVLFINNNERKKESDLESIARKITAEIRGLQNEALAGKKIGIVEAREYNFRTGAAADTSLYYIARYKDSGRATSLEEHEFDLAKKNVTFAAPIDFSFKAPRADVSPVEASGGHKIELHLNVGTVIKRYICVSNFGSVTEENTKCPWE